MAAKRSRTGCQTCRSRKLKCDEVKPICGHCAKSNRECVRSDGIAFRHEQNPSMNANIPKPDRKLKNFFDYRETYTEQDKRSFLPTQQIANNLQWIPIENPMDEDQNPSNPNVATASYQQVASHSLEALSTAATDHPTYLPQGNYADYNSHPASQVVGGGGVGGRAGYGPALHGQNHRNTGLEFILNTSSMQTHNIDPDLERTEDQHLDHDVVGGGGETHEIKGGQPVQQVEEEIEGASKGEGNDYDVLHHLLRDVAEQPAG